MRDRLLGALRYILERLKEPSSQAGLVVILTGWVGLEAKAVSTEQLGGIIAILSGALLTALPSNKL